MKEGKYMYISFACNTWSSCHLLSNVNLWNNNIIDLYEIYIYYISFMRSSVIMEIKVHSFNFLWTKAQKLTIIL